MIVGNRAFGWDIIFRFFVTFPQFELSHFSGVIIVYVDSRYLVRATPSINFQIIPYFSKINLRGGDINSLKLLVIFACIVQSILNAISIITKS